MSELDLLMETNNKRRLSQRPEDKAYMAHWNAAKRSTCEGLRPCSVFGLCPEGQRLDAICRATEAQQSESDSSEHSWWYPWEA